MMLSWVPRILSLSPMPRLSLCPMPRIDPLSRRSCLDYMTEPPAPHDFTEIRGLWMTTATPIERGVQGFAAPAGGPRTVTVQVLAAVPAARDAVTFMLALPGTRHALSAYRAGQFITLAFPTTAGADGSGARILYRSYSLCGDGNAEWPWEITVKRTHGGVVSNFMLDHVRPGMLLRASLPQGTFSLPADLRPATPVVFVAGGSGITPIYGMLRWLARLAPQQRPRVWLHYAYHSPADAIFGRELAALDPEGRWLTQCHYVSTQGLRFRPQRAMSPLGAEAAVAEWYVCGPSELKRSLDAEAARLGIPARRLRAEVFASPSTRDTQRRSSSTSAAATPATTRRLRVADSGVVLDAQSDETLLETLERHGYRPDFSCRAGACGTCRLRLLAGQVCDGTGESGALTDAERTNGYILSCVAQPLGDVTIASAGAPVAAPRRSVAATAGARSGSQGGRVARRKRLRVSLAAAALGLFVSVLGLTNHSPITSSSGTTTSSGSSSSSASSSSSNSNNSSGSSYGSGSITTQPSSSSANSSSGVS